MLEKYLGDVKDRRRSRRTDAPTPHPSNENPQIYCKTEIKKDALQTVLSDPHAPNKFRVLGTLSQFKPFAEAFHCPAGSPMAPLSRCELW